MSLKLMEDMWHAENQRIAALIHEGPFLINNARSDARAGVMPGSRISLQNENLVFRRSNAKNNRYNLSLEKQKYDLEINRKFFICLA